MGRPLGQHLLWSGSGVGDEDVQSVSTTLSRNVTEDARRGCAAVKRAFRTWEELFGGGGDLSLLTG